MLVPQMMVKKHVTTAGGGGGREHTPISIMCAGFVLGPLRQWAPVCVWPDLYL
jgi:hypothetical protein